MEKLKTIISILLSFSLIVIFSSCDGHSQKSQKIKLAEVTRSVFYAPQYVALGLSFFKEEGLDVDLVTLEGSDKTMISLLSSQANIALMGSEMASFVNSKGRKDPVVLFAQLTKKDGSFLMGKDKNFSFENLKNKTIIAGRKGSLPEMTLEYVLKKNNIDPKKDVKLITNIRFELIPGAILSNASNYATLFDPTASLFNQNKGINILKPLSEETNEIAYTCYCSSESYTKNNPGVIESFTRAIYKAQQYTKTHTDEEITDVISPFFKNIQRSLLLQSVRRSKDLGLWAENPSIKKEAFDLMQEIALCSRELETKVDFDKVVNNSFAYKVTKG